MFVYKFGFPVYQTAEDSPHVEEILDELLWLPDKGSFLPGCLMGQLLRSTAVLLVVFPVKLCEFRSFLWAGVVLTRGARAGILWGRAIQSLELLQWFLACGWVQKPVQYVEGCLPCIQTRLNDLMILIGIELIFLVCIPQTISLP